MNYYILTSKDFLPKQWSGGETTQLSIYPKGAEYSKLNFEFRLSTATVEIESSNFTSLPGISRQLMVLEGQLILEHEHKHTITLNVGDVDCFEGDWQTNSMGRCVDFNLMTTRHTKGELRALNIESQNNLKIRLHTAYKFLCLYMYSGSVNLKFGEEDIELHSGNFICFNTLDHSYLQLSSKLGCFGALVKIM
ncbi:HutD family protein [Formosa sp. PL04]|uniref:HutD/Ves family protein n=1 Tax=Formosa sp. PL04 TaxID=3081755 RepID=UPI002981916A|nr:HutD family protein [Formosa sp. PL04]MDW5291020.1 HutD family protein [Formosa sp. PL04]